MVILGSVYSLETYFKMYCIMYISQYPSEISVYNMNLLWQFFLQCFTKKISDARPVCNSDKQLFSGINPPPEVIELLDSDPDDCKIGVKQEWEQKHKVLTKRLHRRRSPGSSPRSTPCKCSNRLC